MSFKSILIEPFQMCKQRLRQNGDIVTEEDEEDFAEYLARYTKILGEVFPLAEPIFPKTLDDCLLEVSCNMFFPSDTARGFWIVLIPNVAICICVSAFALWERRKILTEKFLHVG